MMHGVELRVPFLDPELVALAFQVPDHMKISGGHTKALLKRMAARYIPIDCVYRPKEGFSIPIKNWLMGEFLPVMEEALNADRIKQEGIFNLSTVNRLKHEHLHGQANHSHVLWSMVVFQNWRRMWLRA